MRRGNQWLLYSNYVVELEKRHDVYISVFIEEEFSANIMFRLRFRKKDKVPNGKSLRA